MHAESLIEELGCEDDDFTRVLFKRSHLEVHISNISEHMLSPSLARGKPAFRVLKPHQLAFALFRI